MNLKITKKHLADALSKRDKEIYVLQDQAETTIYVERSKDGRVFANIIKGGKQLAHLAVGQSFTIPSQDQAEAGWIPVGERLPEDEQHVICYVDWRTSREGAQDFVRDFYYRKDYGFVNELDQDDGYGGVKLWAPFPSPRATAEPLL